jgi:hypothetical protein
MANAAETRAVNASGQSLETVTKPPTAVQRCSTEA